MPVFTGPDSSGDPRQLELNDIGRVEPRARETASVRQSSTSRARLMGLAAS